jgi:hypothetical protein
MVECRGIAERGYGTDGCVEVLFFAVGKERVYVE